MEGWTSCGQNVVRAKHTPAEGRGQKRAVAHVEEVHLGEKEMKRKRGGLCPKMGGLRGTGKVGRGDSRHS